MKKIFVLLLFSVLFFIPINVEAQTTVTSAQSGNWSSPSTWVGGVVPSGQTVTISAGHTVVYNMADTAIAGMTISSGGELQFAPGQSATLRSTGNIIDYGRLVMKPATPVQKHTIRFFGFNEANFQGGGMSPVSTDVGLWVMCLTDGADGMCDPASPGGVLDLMGAAKTTWTRAVGSIAQGATQITLEAPAIGWQIGDTLSIVPTLPPSAGAIFYNGFDPAVITAINGSVVTLNRAMSYAHPALADPFDPTKVYRAEVANLSGNVRIEGVCNGAASPTGNSRSHVFVRSTQPQSIKYTIFNCLGPRKVSTSDPTAGILGRYPFHLHHSGDASRGSVILGSVFTNSGNHAIVNHGSHGATYQDDVVWNTFDDPVWWDAPACSNNCMTPDINDSNDIVIDRLLVAIARYDPSSRGFRLSGVLLRKGYNNSITNSVVVGIQGNVDAAGISWAENGHGVWVFKFNLAHNNKVNAYFVWQNNSLAHILDDNSAYYNDTCFDLGAYLNGYVIKRLTCIGNLVGFVSRASSGGPINPNNYGQTIDNLKSNSYFRIGEHNLAPLRPILVINSTVLRIAINEQAKTTPGKYDFVNVTRLDGTCLQPTDITISFAWPNSLYRFECESVAWQMTGNGTVTTIAPFYGGAGAAEISTPIFMPLIEAGVIP